jgi:hypothetical protein
MDYQTTIFIGDQFVIIGSADGRPVILTGSGPFPTEEL